MKAYVLNLETSVERLNHFRETYPACLPQFEVWRAKPPEECQKPDWWLGTAEFNSHRENFLDVLTSCVETDEDVLFFEDDCIFAENFQEAYETFIGETPSDWECLNFCTNHMNAMMFSPVQISENVLRPKLGFNTNAMLFRPSEAVKMKAQLEKTEWGCKHIVEQQLGYLYLDPNFKAYAPLQNFVDQGATGPEYSKFNTVNYDTCGQERKGSVQSSNHIEDIWRILSLLGKCSDREREMVFRGLLDSVGCDD